MYRKFSSIVVLMLLGLATLLPGCGEEGEETASLTVSIGMSPAMSQGNYLARVTITGPGMEPTTKTQDLAIILGGNRDHKMNIDNISPGNNLSVRVEILMDWETLFEASDTVDLLSGSTNYLRIKVSPVNHELFIDNEVTMLDTADLENGLVEIDASKSYDTHYDIEISWDWGDGEVTDFNSRFRAEHTYTSPSVYEVTITCRDQSDNPVVETMSVTVDVKPKSGTGLLDSSLIIPGVGAAGISIGDPVSKVRELYGEPDYFDDVFGWLSYYDVGISVTFWGDTGVDGIFISEPNGSKTGGGNGIGSTRASVESEFGLAEEIDGVDHWYWTKGINFGYYANGTVENIYIFEPLFAAPARQARVSQDGRKIRSSSLLKEHHRTARRAFIRD
jgi:hypothetical protein